VLYHSNEWLYLSAARLSRRTKANEMQNADFLRLQQAEDQAFLMEIVEGVKVEGTFFLTNLISVSVLARLLVIHTNIHY
jgi:hypothetical protein